MPSKVAVINFKSELNTKIKAVVYCGDQRENVIL